VVSVAAIIAVAANTEGRREIVDLHIGPSEAEPFWSFFLKGLLRRGLSGVKLVISDAHEGLKAAIAKTFGATWQRCRVHWMRNALDRVPKSRHSMVSAALRQGFLQPDAASASQIWRHIADQLRGKWPKLASFMDETEHDVLAYMTFSAQHRVKLHSTNPLEKLNKEMKRRADVVGIFPNAQSVRLIGAILLEQNDEWQLQTATCRSRPCPNSTPNSTRRSQPKFHPRQPDRLPPQTRRNLHHLDGRDLYSWLETDDSCTCERM
jgi:putative transposase